jgi:hypothetical protein
MAPADFGVCRSHHELFALPCVMVCLKNVLKPELNNPRIDDCAGNLPKRTIPYPGIGISELWGIKGVVKFGPELERVAFTYRGVFDDGNIPVMLAGTFHDTHPRIAPTGAVAVDSACRRIAEHICIKVSVQPVADAP